MAKELNLFQQILSNLYTNIFPSITIDLNKMGMEYAHTAIRAHHSLCFFHALGMEFPFQGIDLITIKEDDKMVPIVYFNLKNNGEVSICTSLQTSNNGLVLLENNFILFKHFDEMFRKNIIFDNTFLCLLSKELTATAKNIKNDIILLESLLNDMQNIKPTISREVIVEKNKN